jgi:hypothetical protein
MPNIIFKKDISNNVLFDFLKINCLIENDYYIIDKLIYKKYEYNNLISEFFNNIKENYKDSKKYYLEREITYNNLLTVIRHICKYNNIPYLSKIRYDKNKYYIIYYIKNIE